MEKLENTLKAIIIPSGNEMQDLVRAKKAREHSENTQELERYIVAGLDFHKNLYNYLMQETKTVFGLTHFQ